MAEFWSAWDSAGRYRIRLTVNETWTDSGANTSGGNWQLALFGSSSWTFYDWDTYSNVYINGTLVHNVTGRLPKYAWTASSGVEIAKGTWGVTHNADGSYNMGSSAHFNGTGVDSRYGPRSALNVSGSQ